MMAARRALLPVAVFAAAVVAHYTWLGLFPEAGSAAECSAPPPGQHVSWPSRYVEGQSYWMGLSYGLALAFTAATFRRYLERRASAARDAAIGGVTLTGLLALAGCFLV
jgi:hypothetical protein